MTKYCNICTRECVKRQGVESVNACVNILAWFNCHVARGCDLGKPRCDFYFYFYFFKKPTSKLLPFKNMQQYGVSREIGGGECKVSM